MDPEQKRKRVKVLERALVFENLVSTFLAMLLDIDINNSKTLGNSSSSISFNNKVDLLLDIKTIDKSIKSKFMSFMNIRNQFMHNLRAKSFEECINQINGLSKWLLKNYPQRSELSIEDRLEKCFDELSEELFFTIVGIVDDIKKKIKGEVRNNLNKIGFESAKEAIKDVARVFDETYPEIEIKGKKYSKAGEAFEQLAMQKILMLIEENKDNALPEVSKTVELEDFTKADIRTGKIISIEEIDRWKDYVKVIVDVEYATLCGVVKKGNDFDRSKLIEKTVCVVVNIKDLKTIRGVKVDCQVLTSTNDKGEVVLIYANGIEGGFVVR